MKILTFFKQHNTHNIVHILILCITFVPTVHTTLPIRTASQGVSFAFITFRNAVALPLHNAHYAALFYTIVPALHTVRSAGGSFFFVPLAQ